MSPDKIFITVNDKRISLADLAKMDKNLIITVYASGCTALAALDAPVAEYVYASGCTALAALDAPVAEYVDARGVPASNFPCIDAGENERGYDLFAVRILGQWRIIAGCRNLSVEGAFAHWGLGSARAHPDIFARVETIAAAIAAMDAEPAQP